MIAEKIISSNTKFHQSIISKTYNKHIKNIISLELQLELEYIRLKIKKKRAEYM